LDKDPKGDIINHGHFRITEPGHLHTPVQAFTVHRDEALELILETRAGDDAMSAAPEIPAGTIRIASERVELTNISDDLSGFLARGSGAVKAAGTKRS
jgi:hypothetical protein